MASLAFESSGPLCPKVALRYAPTSAKIRLFHMVWALRPTTWCASAPSMSGAGAGVGATDEDAQGKRQAGVVFHRSCTVGLLFSDSPTMAFFENTRTLSANRTSMLSTPKDPSCGLYVICRKPPVFVLKRPPRNT